MALNLDIASTPALMQIGAMDRVMILGASRGLGAALVRYGTSQGVAITGFARKAERLELLKQECSGFEYFSGDFSRASDQEKIIQHLLVQKASKIFYVAGGGPYGKFGQHQMKDHMWAIEVSFLFPARLLHALLTSGQGQEQAQGLGQGLGQAQGPQVILVGSSIAESEPDIHAAAYCAAKHALLSLVQTLRLENPAWDLRIFSPGYLDTEMLPLNAAVRQKGVYKTNLIARELWEWSFCPDRSGHKVYPKHPIC